MDPKVKWNKKYHERLRTPTEIVPNERLQSLSLYFNGGRALDWACGLGGNSLFLAKNGYDVTAIDISNVAIEFLSELASKNQLLISPQLADLTDIESVYFDEKSFDFIVVTYYLDRTIIPYLKTLLNTNGYFFMETFSLTNNNINEKISNEFKLTSNELLSIFNDSEILYFEENEKEGRQTILVRKR